MKTHSINFKEKIKLFGRQLDSKITYTLNEETIELGAEELNSVVPHYEGAILKSVMKQLEIDSNIDIPLNTVLNYQFGVKVGDEYEYINFGNYVVYKSEKQEDMQSYKITCYDKMLYSMIDYESMNISYPITIRNYINAICNKLGLTFKNANSLFANYDKQIQNELYLDSDGNSLGYTFRDVLDELAQVTASSICINEVDDELEIRYITDTEDTIDEEFLKDINVNFGEKYGPINSIVLSRASESDNVYLSDDESIAENGLTEIKIKDNQIMNFNDRSDYLPDILETLDGLEYYLNDFSSPGICYYDLCDRYNIQIGENTYYCVMFNDEINITQGLDENVHTELPEETETDYTKADKTDRRINQTYRMVDKQNGIIQDLASRIVDVSNTISGISSITLENAHEGILHQLSIKGQISLLFPQSEEGLYGYPLVPKDGLVPSNTLVPSSPVPYGNKILYPNNSLYSKSNILLIDETEYKLDFDFLNYINNNICDEFIYEDGNCYIVRRVGIDSNSDKYALNREVIEPRQPITLKVKEDSTISLKSFDTVFLSSTYLTQNEYTNTFATQVEVQSTITQTADNILEQVSAKVGDDEIVAKLNLAVKNGQGIVELKGNTVIIESDNFNLDEEGNVDINGTITSNNGQISSWNITDEALTNSNGSYIQNRDLTFQSQPYNCGVTNIYTMSDVLICQAILLGIIPEPLVGTATFKHYDFNNDGVINSADLQAIAKLLGNE